MSAPLIDVLISVIKVNTVYDTGSQVSIVIEKLFREKFRGVELKTGTWYRLTAADGLDIPFLGYMIGEVVVWERDSRRCGGDGSPLF